MTDSTAPARMIPMTLQQIEELLPLARSISSVDAWDAWCAVILQWSYAANAEIGRLRNMVAELERELAEAYDKMEDMAMSAPPAERASAEQP